MTSKLNHIFHYFYIATQTKRNDRRYKIADKQEYYEQIKKQYLLEIQPTDADFKAWKQDERKYKVLQCITDKTEQQVLELMEKMRADLKHTQ